MISGLILVDVKADDLANDNLTESLNDPQIRLTKYHFGPDFFQLRTIGLQVEF